MRRSPRSASSRHRLQESATDDFVSFDGFCVPCNARVALQLAMGPTGPLTGHRNPNWRETLTCPMCGMNNRQRLVATLTQGTARTVPRQDCVFHGAGHTDVSVGRSSVSATPHHRQRIPRRLHQGGQVAGSGVRHEDVMNLSFPAESLDLIVSNDVFEHVPEPTRASPSVHEPSGAAGRYLRPCRFTTATTNQ